MARKSLVRLIFIFLLVQGIFCSTFAFAETIVFKWGKKVEEKIIKKTDEYIEIDFQGTPLIYRLYDIESIDGMKPALSSKEAGSESSYENTLSKKDSESQGSLAASTESALNSDYSNFDVFRIKIPKGWIISQKKERMITRVAFTKEPYDAANFYGFLIMYAPSGSADSGKIYEGQFIKKFEEQAKKYLGKYGDALANTRVSKIRFNNVQALQFEADIPRPDIRASNIVFNKNGFAFSIVLAMPISQYDRYGPIINDSLSTFELTRTDSDFLQQQTKKTKQTKYLFTIIGFVCAPLCYYLAKRKNMAWPIMWAIFSFLLAIIPVIILLIIPKRGMIKEK